MSYFRYFPKLRDKSDRQLVDILRTFKFVEAVKSNSVYYSYDIVRDGEKVEDVAYRLYGDPELHIVLILMNDIVDPYYDWILSENELKDYVKRKYGSENIFTTHHYETTESNDLGAGEVVPEGTEFANSVSNYNYEDRINETKREIKVLKEEYLNQFEEELSRAFG